MPMLKLPISGDYIDPSINEIGTILVRKKNEAHGFPKSAVLILTKMAQYVLECKDDDEAIAMRDLIAARSELITGQKIEDLSKPPSPPAADGSLPPFVHPKNLQ